MTNTGKPIFFARPAEFRRWLDRNHDKQQELWVGYYKRASGKPSLTWQESVEQALCFGWIDGVRKSYDGDSYMIRFTPRKPKSIWSAKNIKSAHELIEQGLMKPAGLEAFKKRDEARSRVYAFEQEAAALGAYEKQIKANKKAWAFFQAQPPSYRKTVSWWIISAKREETRLKRLAQLIEDSAAGRRIGILAHPGDST